MVWHYLQKNRKNFSLFLLTIFCIFTFNNLFITSSSATQEELDGKQLSELITNLEDKWERDYEEYFSADFNNYSFDSGEIAERLAEIHQKTKLNPAVIWAVPQEEQLQLLLITPSNQITLERVKPANKRALPDVIKQLERELVKTSRNNYTSYLPPAKLLYQWIVEPLEPQLKAENIDTILFCTGSLLRSLPFAALYDEGDQKFLIEKYNLARIPAFNLTDTSYQNRQPKQVLAMGASEFADQPALPGVEVELSLITPQIWSGTKMLNKDFTVENLKSQYQQRKYDIVHLATHSQFNPGSPKDSYIQFSDRKLTLEQIQNLGLDRPPVDLLVLSACETALGDEEAEFGFAGLALQAGVKSVIASLWLISDAGTVALMSEFYQNLKSEPIQVTALRKAQIAMLKGEVYVEKGQLRGFNTPITLPPTLSQSDLKNLSHPFYWSGFTIIGSPW
jgi:CHAT domain-containing protein